MTNHEYKFRWRDMQFKLHSPWTKTFERLRTAERIVVADASDEAKLEKLLQLFSPGIYQFDVCRVKTVEEEITPDAAQS